MTNFEKYKAKLKPEEVAEHLSFKMCDECLAYDYCSEQLHRKDVCKEVILEWLELEM